MSENPVKEDKVVEERPGRAILFELEGVAVDGRQILFDVMKKVLKDKGVKLTPPLYSRHCLVAHLADAVTPLLKKGPDEKIVKTIAHEFNRLVVERSKAVNPGFEKILKLAKDRDIGMGAVSCLSQAAAEALATKLGLTSAGASLQVNAADDRLIPSADTWLKLARQMDVMPPLCGALVTSMGSSKAALSAGAKCVVVTDAFNSFQDYGGADYVVDSLDEVVGNALIDLLMA